MVKMMNRYIVLFFLIISFWLGCSPGGTNPPPLNIYTPNILDDGKPNVEGDFWDIANSPDINLNQKAFVEAFTFGQSLKRDATPRLAAPIDGLGITDLSPLKGLSAVLGNESFPFSKVVEMSFYSTRLNDITAIIEFEDLKSLIISGSDIEDFTPISNLKKLKYLDISYSKTSSLIALKSLTNIEELTLDSESNISLNEIQHLMLPHLNDDGKEIKLKVIYHKEKRGGDTPIHIFRNYMNAKVTPTLKGVYSLIGQNSLPPTEGNFIKADPKDKFEGKLILDDLTYEINIEINAVDLVKTIIQKGTYTSIGNLITFKPENGAEYTSSYLWFYSLTFYLIDRTNFPEFTSLNLKFKKKSDNPQD